jgi:hypothetical protein
MDYTSLLVKLLPAAVLPYLKFVVTVLGGVATSVLVTYPGVDHRVAIASAALTALGTYLTPNVQTVRLLPAVAESVDPEPEPDLVVYNNGLTGEPGLPQKPVAATSTPVTEAPAAAPVVHEIGV